MVDDSDCIRAEAVAYANNEIAFFWRPSVTLPFFQSAARKHTLIYGLDIRSLDGRDVDHTRSNRYDMICGLGWTGLDGEDQRAFAGGGDAHVCGASADIILHLRGDLDGKRCSSH